MDAANGSFEIMKKKHKNLVIPECGLFLDKTNCFIGASPDCLMTCDAFVKMKCPLSINYEKPNEKNLDYGYESDKEIKLRTIHSYFTQCILQMAMNQQKPVLYGHRMAKSLTLQVLMASCGRTLKRNLLLFMKIFILFFSGNS